MHPSMYTYICVAKLVNETRKEATTNQNQAAHMITQLVFRCTFLFIPQHSQPFGMHFESLGSHVQQGLLSLRAYWHIP
jgi:hypothetical protein